MQKKNDRRDVWLAKFRLARCPSTCVRIRVPPCIHACTAPLRYATNSSFFFSFDPRANDGDHGCNEAFFELRVIFLSPSLSFLFTVSAPLPSSPRVLLLLLLLSSLSCPPTSLSFSFSFSFLHRSGKDPPRVALHERVVDEESVKLALRQHYPAGYRYLGCLVISSRVRPTV